MKARILLIAIAVVLSSGSAFADTRGDVMERLSRCSNIPDERTWLDCYYGAAQPARAELGLAPAPQAGTFESLFNRPGAAATSQIASPPAMDTGQGTGGIFGMFNADNVPPEQFGLTNARPGRGVNVDRIVEKLASYTFAGGKFTVTLANGQVWRQTGGPNAIWRSTPANYTATITHGALHTFNLRVQNGPHADDTMYKVERIH